MIMAVYVYSITSKDHPVRLDGLTPVGGSGGSLRTVTNGDLSAVVSDAPRTCAPGARTYSPTRRSRSG